MKKIMCITMILILSFSFIACNDESVAILTEQNEVKEYLANNYEKFNIDGSTSMIPLHQSLNDLFGSNDEEIEHSKTVDAFEKLIKGENDILLGVDYSDELLEKAKDNGIELVKKEITREAFVFLINVNNPVKSLTIEQIKDIYSRKITSWSEVGGDDAPITAYQRNSDSGSQMRMVKFMGDTKLTSDNVEYVAGMGYVVERIADYDEGKYSIAYNMYTFTEKQYPSDEVILLSVDGVYPDDESIFDETYPIVIYNYIYYDANNESASEFAENLYSYLMSDEGQQLINDSGYVNLNTQYDRNKDIDTISEYESEVVYGFYNEERCEFYDVEYDFDGNGKLIIYYDYVDYVLQGSEYEDNVNARELLELIFYSDIVKNPDTATLYQGTIIINPWFDGSLDAEDFFNFMYDGLYYSGLTYYIDEDKYVFSASDENTFDLYVSIGAFTYFSKYTDNYIPSATIEITKDDLKHLYMRTIDSLSVDVANPPENGVEIEFFQPFK